MNRGELILLVGLLAYVNSVPTDFQTVWLKDVTTTIQTDKRTLGDPGLPAHLTFHLMLGSDALTLNLKRNYEIDPNADIYVVQGTKDGESILTKTRHLEQENVAYYQDMEHGAYMTVKCIRRLNHQCDRVINGNIQIRDSSYELRQAETRVTSGNSLRRPDRISKRYYLLDQRRIGFKHLAAKQDALRVNETSVHEQLEALFRGITGQEKQNYFRLQFGALPPRNNGHLDDDERTDKSRQLKENYYVKVAILIDSGVWDSYFSRISCVDPTRKMDEVKRKIREAYSHIMNGVNLRYKSIDDPNLSITVIPQRFIFFLSNDQFPHNQSKVISFMGENYIEAAEYLLDLYNWDLINGVNLLPQLDIAMLFTTNILYKGSMSELDIDGISLFQGVCEFGFRTLIIEADHYQRTVYTATNELGHSLGADHDGEGDAVACKSEDSFIMANVSVYINKDRLHIRNMWIFSNCSVESFKKTLKSKQCVHNIGAVYDLDEWTKFMKNQPGDVFTPQEQCFLLYGPGFTYYETKSEDLCHLLTCINPSGTKIEKYIIAARGTPCGENKWCIEGRCVSKVSK